MVLELLTSLHRVNAHIIYTRLYLSFNEFCRCGVNPVYPNCVLRSKSSGGCHSITSKRSGSLLVGLEATELALVYTIRKTGRGNIKQSSKIGLTYAPPDESDPAIIKIRLRCDMVKSQEHKHIKLKIVETDQTDFLSWGFQYLGGLWWDVG